MRPGTLRAAALAVLAIATVLPVFGGEHVLDDEFLQRHPVASGAKPWWEAFRSHFLAGEVPAGGNPYYRPLPLLWFRLEHEIAGGSMLLAHATNTLLHALNTLLLWGLLAGRLPRTSAWLGAALFAVHPVHAEAVAWVSARSDVLALTFLLLALYLLRKRPWAATAAFLAAVLAKETALLFPLAVLPFVRGPLHARLRCAFPLATGVAAYAALRVAALPVRAGWTPEQVAALPSTLGVGGTYLRMLVLPFPLGFQRAIEMTGSPLRLEFLPGYALLTAGAVLFARRSEARPGVVWVCVFLLPVCGFFPVLPLEPGAWPFGERFLYIPSAGLAALAGALLPTTRCLWIPLLGVAAGLMAWHSAHFRSTTALVEGSIRWFPGVANLWATRGDIALDRSLSALSEGNDRASRSAAAAAVSDLERALAIRPGWYRARRTLAQALASCEQPYRSEALFRELLRENPRDPIPPSNLAFLLYRLGRKEEAQECLLEALRRDPGFGPARANLAQLDSCRPR